MDLSQLNENDKAYVNGLLEKKQAKQFMSLYGSIVNHCFEDCVKEFTSETMGKNEKECINKCTTKILRLTNRIGQQMAEKQMNIGGAGGGGNGTTL